MIFIFSIFFLLLYQAVLEVVTMTNIARQAYNYLYSYIYIANCAYYYCVHTNISITENTVAS